MASSDADELIMTIGQLAIWIEGANGNFQEIDRGFKEVADVLEILNARIEALERESRRRNSTW